MLCENWSKKLDELLTEPRRRLDDWAEDFVVSMRDQRSRKGREWQPTDKQLAALQREYEDAFSPRPAKKP